MFLVAHSFYAFLPCAHTQTHERELGLGKVDNGNKIFSIMSFYHILPSNTSLQYFPNNNASQFSTPVEASYHLSGKWEIALTNMTYTPCVITFNNEIITVENNCSKDPSSCPVKYDLLNATKPVKVWLTPTDDIPIDAVSSLTKEIEEKLRCAST